MDDGNQPGDGTTPPASERGRTRREFLRDAALTGVGLAASAAPLELASEAVAATAQAVPLQAGNRSITLHINGVARPLQLEPRVTLLDALRNRLALNGSKKGCDHGQCGACTVLIDGRRTKSCLTLAVVAEGKAITTVEGLGTEDELHPLQQAFIAHDAFQCGYCTPGQLCSAVGLLTEGRPADDAAIREGMSGNICRCGAYPNIVDAIREVRDSGARVAPRA